ncbi:YcnI family copper-binding membrane protein [Streptacidiphilus rugosus]|uniref:YcnI family copper-binding membrane protein n=1 Tax=Streptacidiphilus rugosus TaxID=405783 RepID=UPI00056D3B9B|nr:YcnI family protein [Streptacidiphilus rugosus]
MRKLISVPRRLAVPVALGAGAVLLLAGPASAHVTVQPDSAAAGAADQAFAFRVPNESDTASTVKVDVYFPTDHPIASALVESVPGWTSEVKTTKLATPIQTDDGPVTEAVSEIVWTGGKIAPGEYQDFTVDFGQLPKDAKQLAFKTLQTYSDGSVVRWIDTPAGSGGTEPQHPAPTLNLTAAGANADSADAKGAAGATGGTQTAASSDTGDSSDTAARVLGGVGVVVGLGGVALGFLGWRRGGRGGQGAA